MSGIFDMIIQNLSSNFNFNQKTTTLLGGYFKFRHRPIFPGRFQPSIVGTAELNYCVRDGNRWDLYAIDTECSVFVCPVFPDDIAYYSTEFSFVNPFFQIFLIFFNFFEKGVFSHSFTRTLTISPTYISW